MIKEINNKTVLYKLFVSYFLIFILPLIFLSAVLYKTSVVDLQKEIEYSNLHKINQLKDFLDMRMKELEYQALRINLDHRLTPFVMTSDFYTKYESLEKLAMYKANNAFAEEFMIYYRNNNSVFLPTGQCSLETLAKYIYVMGGEKEKQFNHEIATIRFPIIKPVEKVVINNQEMEALTYMHPISYGNNEPYAVVIFLIKKAVFDQMIEDILGEMPGNVSVLDKNNNILVRSNNKDFSPLYGPDDIVRENLTPGVHRMTKEGKNSALIYSKSSITGWSFISEIETTHLFKKAIYMRTVILQVVFGLFTFGVFIIILLASKNYRPIRKLVGSISSQWTAPENAENMNEFDWIDYMVTSALSQNKDLQAQIDLQRPMIKDQLLTKLLKGEFEEQTSTENLFHLAQVNLPGPYYVVMVLKGVSDNCIYQDSIFLILNNYLENEKLAYPIELIQSNAIAILVNLNEHDEEKQYQKQLARKIKQVMEKEIDEEIIIGIGKKCENISQLNRSFIEAMAALEHNIIKGYERIVFFDEIMTENRAQIYWYPTEDQIRFMQSLKQGDKNVAFEAIDRMICSIEEKEASVQMIRCVCFDIINMVVKTMNEMNISEFNNDVEKLINFISLKDMGKNLRSLAGKLCTRIEEKKRNNDSELCSEILKYINDHYSNFGLSLENMSDCFKLPVYYLSRFFKEQVGCTFTDYVTKLRMDKAKYLLCYTEKTIKDIVELIGYSDLTSFTRRFKQVEGITPGQYRKLSSGNDI